MRRWIVIAIAALFLTACGEKKQETKSQKREMNLYIWSAYVTEAHLKKFEKDTGIHVNFDTYDSNEALLEKMQSGVSDYDVVVPSDYMITILTHQNLLEKLDHAKIPNLKNLSKRFSDELPSDSGNHYSVPLYWGTSGIGYNKTKVTDPVDSWGILWNSKYKNRILMLDDPREVFAVALKFKGHSLNSTNPAELEEAKKLLMQQKPLVKTFTSSNFDEILLSGDVWLAHGWSGQLAKAADQNKDLAYVIPREGTTIWVDSMAIPKLAHHKEEAHVFMNYFLDPHVSAEISEYSGYATPNDAAKQFIKPEMLNDPARYPDEAKLANCEFLKDLGETTLLLDRFWTEIKSQ